MSLSPAGDFKFSCIVGLSGCVLKRSTYHGTYIRPSVHSCLAVDFELGERLDVVVLLLYLHTKAGGPAGGRLCVCLNLVCSTFCALCFFPSMMWYKSMSRLAEPVLFLSTPILSALGARVLLCHQHQSNKFNKKTAQRFLLSPGDHFFVPVNNIYRLENHSDEARAVIYWTIVKVRQKAAK